MLAYGQTKDGRKANLDMFKELDDWLFVFNNA